MIDITVELKLVGGFWIILESIGGSEPRAVDIIRAEDVEERYVKQMCNNRLKLMVKALENDSLYCVSETVDV